MTPGRFLLILLVCLSGPPLAYIFKDYNRPDVGDPAKPLVDNILAQPNRVVGSPSALPQDKVSRYVSARDYAVSTLLSPNVGRAAAWCDASYVRHFQGNVDAYLAQKIRVVSDVLKQHGEGQARQVEALWMNAGARSAEALIREGMSHRLIDFDDLGRSNRIEARRLALGLQTRPKTCTG
jgi:hypothetical protein